MSDANKRDQIHGGKEDEDGTRKAKSTTMPRMKGTLGSTPNHLTLSTTSTLSVGSTGSAAKLIQASGAPAKYTTAPTQPEPSNLIMLPNRFSFYFVLLSQLPIINHNC